MDNFEEYLKALSENNRSFRIEISIKDIPNTNPQKTAVTVTAGGTATEIDMLIADKLAKYFSVVTSVCLGVSYDQINEDSWRFVKLFSEIINKKITELDNEEANLKIFRDFLSGLE